MVSRFQVVPRKPVLRRRHLRFSEEPPFRGKGGTSVSRPGQQQMFPVFDPRAAAFLRGHLNASRALPCWARGLLMSLVS